MNEKIMKDLGFGQEVNLVKSGMCPTCGQPIDTKAFKDDLSRKEFTISGMCQVCQDSIFGG